MIIKKKFQKNGETSNEQIVGDKVDIKTTEVDVDKIDLFDLDNIDFTQRQERRKGDRRRGYRRTEDRNLISRAREEALAIKEAAAKEGYQDGLKDLKEDIEQIKSAVKSFLTAKQEVFDYISGDILEISVEIARKIIKKEITQNPNLIMDNISEILKELSKEETKIMLRVNPSQAALVKQEIPEVISLTGLDAKVTIIPDESISEGGCLMTTSNGVTDATVEAQLAIIKEALKEI